MQTEPEPRSSHRPFLDKIRWVSALIVAIGHSLAIINNKAGGSGLLTYVSDMRDPAVIVFFLLSGFLVGGSVIKNIAAFSFRTYIISRTSRIYIVLVPALLLTLTLDGIARLAWPMNAVYAHAWQGGALGNFPIFSRYRIENILGSLLSIEPLTGLPMGSAGSLWSLGYE